MSDHYPASLLAPLVDLDRSASKPLYRQIARSLREAVTDGTLSPATRLSPTRTLADELEVSRNTVIKAYDQLRSEGYFEAQVGSGTYVSTDLPEQHTRVRRPSEMDQTLQLADTSTRSSSLSRSAEQVMNRPLSKLEDPGSRRAFRPGIPALDAFPIELWSKLVSRRWRSLPPEELVYGNPTGYPPLREAVAEYLRTVRGVRCETEEVLIVSGVQQALALASRVLLDDGETVWVENPGFPRMRETFAAAGAEPQPVSVDENGLNLSAALSTSDETSTRQTPRMVGVTPSHQYPLGVTMGLSRRLELLEWAARTDTWIFEDDYDSEYRYSGRPLAALQGLDNAGRVLYAGTFSKVLFPALRLGYLVVPPDLVEAFAHMRSLADRCPPRVQQMVLTDFIEEGHFQRHVRKMRTLYASRQSALLEAVEDRLSDLIEIEPSNAGLHLVGWLPEDIDDETVSERLREEGIVAPPLSFYSETPLERGGLLLGYAGVSQEEIREGVAHMARVLKSVHV